MKKVRADAFVLQRIFDKTPGGAARDTGSDALAAENSQHTRRVDAFTAGVKGLPADPVELPRAQPVDINGFVNRRIHRQCYDHDFVPFPPLTREDGSKQVSPRITSDAAIAPAAGGTKEVEPGISRRSVHFLLVPGGQIQ